MSLTHEAVQAWLDAYIRAWETYDAADVEALFTEDGEYRYHPFDEPESGRDKIVWNWLNPNGDPSGRDKPVLPMSSLTTAYLTCCRTGCANAAATNCCRKPTSRDCC